MRETLRRLSRYGQALFAALVAVIFLARPAAAVSVDWGQTYLNWAHTGNNTRETILSSANVSGLRLRWARTFTGEARALVVNDHYVIAQIPSDDGKSLQLWYVNYLTGEDQWHLVLGPDVPGAEGTLATGNKEIYTGCGLIDQIGYNYSGICAFSKKNQRQIWRFANPCNCAAEANVVGGLTFDPFSNAVLFGYFNGGNAGKDYLLATSAMRGQIYGAFQTGGLGSLDSATPARGLGKIFLGCGGDLCALNHQDGSFAWKATIGAHVAGISVDSARVYVALCNGAAGLMAFDDTGSLRWSYGAPQCNQYPAAISGGAVYLTSADGNVHALDASTGSEIWSATAQATSSSSLANGVLFVGGGPGGTEASAYDASTGSLLWEGQPHSASHHPPPVIIDGMLFTANGACGTLCAFSLPGGRDRGARNVAAKTSATAYRAGLQPSGKVRKAPEVPPAGLSPAK